MKNIIFASILILLSASCNKSKEGTSEQGNISFDLIQLDGFDANNEMSDPLKVVGNQDQDINIKFKVYNVEEDGYIWFLYNEGQSDLLRIIGSVVFNVTAEDGSPINEVSLKFVYKESASNVEVGQDGLVTYNELEDLLATLKSIDFSKNFFEDNSNQQVLFEMPVVEELPITIYSEHLTSNGLYFEEENFNMDNIEMKDDQIIMNGKMNCILKELSCGFLSFYKVSDVNFKIVIQ